MTSTESQPMTYPLIDLHLREQVLNWLSDQVPRSRIEHILRVEQMAIDLAIQHQLNVAIAQIAGLMHDLAKYFQPQVLLKMAIAEGVELDEILESHPHLLHADISAVVARKEFGIEDQEVLDAIANHTLGKPQLSPLSCVVFLADTLEPGRGDTAELQALRSLCNENLYHAVWKTCDYTLAYLMKTCRVVHPRIILTRNWALQTYQGR
ncbi:MAG: bis(5'-nucleosyl)-tetraphosphatase (symmetrical) YqeK [Limnoraphis robusta]|uniref:bis(5'-nucleosyl)-tetraphosphatase (symmetrical) n=1 Tax=Limnoraphis robusta CCNP1315 TaxID=3110306 RepID=A0ABU5U4I2_9CYAN|nr:bis(5'-nucleosyl)-tetraphosphatase (symmetrical) YqeK [Limnoraphis robusta]MEA5499889.1 bis(5'-nucleosyl)-tetraphosphatase (symmetrical) YqeK [Limnoraphis robusta BA-68 BA1]MEA5521553.1 bis(5'-nucleosyl)-tetraphosphatase (symmetrical) YqeK [Limnoraphis robusta CCNP1315]MEA5544495.1 bis(5'-nucleosyl)-tetraphosphatase (symmetrical) YqeK [Limnoraphis robusta CCNP1324]